MTDNQIAQIIADALRWAASASHSPAFVNVKRADNRVTFITPSGGKFTVTVYND